MPFKMELKYFISGSTKNAFLSCDLTYRLSVAKDACKKADFDCIKLV